MNRALRHQRDELTETAQRDLVVLHNVGTISIISTTQPWQEHVACAEVLLDRGYQSLMSSDPDICVIPRQTPHTPGDRRDYRSGPGLPETG